MGTMANQNPVLQQNQMSIIGQNGQNTNVGNQANLSSGVNNLGNAYANNIQAAGMQNQIQGIFIYLLNYDNFLDLY